MENQIIQEGIIYTLEVNQNGEKIARITGHTPELVGTLEEHHPSSYRTLGGPSFYITFSHNGSDYGPVEIPLTELPTMYVIKEGLVNITIPEEVGVGYKVFSIEDSALKGCNRIKSLDLPASLRLIDNYALAGCCNLSKMELRGKVNISSLKSPFGNTRLHSLTVHNSEALVSAENILTGIKLERHENIACNVRYPNTVISVIFIAEDATISEEEIEKASKHFKVLKKK